MACLRPQFLIKSESNQEFSELSTFRVHSELVLTDYLNDARNTGVRDLVANNLSVTKIQSGLIQSSKSEVDFRGLDNNDLCLLAWIDFCQMLDKAIEHDQSELDKLKKEMEHMIKVGYAPVNESVGTSWKDFEEGMLDNFGGSKSDPDFKGAMQVYYDAAKLLGCRPQDTLSIGEDEGEPLFDKIMKTIKSLKPSSKKRVDDFDSIEIYEVEGTKIAMVNSEGYLSAFYKKSDEKNISSWK